MQAEAQSPCTESYTEVLAGSPRRTFRGQFQSGGKWVYTDTQRTHTGRIRLPPPHADQAYGTPVHAFSSQLETNEIFKNKCIKMYFFVLKEII